MPVLTMVGVATVTLDVVVKASLGYAITIWTSTLMRVAAAAKQPLLSHPTMVQLRRSYFSTPVVVLVVMIRYRTRNVDHRSRRTYRWHVPVWFCG